MVSVRHLGKNTILYAIGTFLRYSVALILIPIYTSALNASEYGALETLTVIVQTLLILVNFGLSNSLLRYYIECEDEAEALTMVRTSALIVLVFSFSLLCLFVPFASQISISLLKDETYANLVILAYLWAVGSSLNEQLFAYYRARQDAKTYVIFSLGLFLVLVTLNISLVLLFQLRVFGVLLGNLLAVWGLNSWFFVRFYRHSFEVSRHWALTLLGFGFPLIFSRFGWLLLNSADRYFLAYYHDLSEVGMYGLGYKAGLLVQIAVIVPFQLAWGPFVFERFSTELEKAIADFSKVFTYLLLGFSFTAMAILMYSKEIISLLGSNKFEQAIQVVPYILVAYLFNGIYYWAGNLFHLKKRTTLLSVIVFGMAILNLLLNWIFVPIAGWEAAAVVTVITIGSTGLITLFVSKSFYPVPLQLPRIAKIILATIVIIGFYTLFPVANDITSWFMRGMILLSYPFLLLAIGFFTKSEIAFLGLLPNILRQKAISTFTKT